MRRREYFCIRVQIEMILNLTARLARPHTRKGQLGALRDKTEQMLSMLLVTVKYLMHVEAVSTRRHFLFRLIANMCRFRVTFSFCGKCPDTEMNLCNLECKLDTC